MPISPCCSHSCLPAALHRLTEWGGPLSGRQNTRHSWMATAHPLCKHVPHPADKPEERSQTPCSTKSSSSARHGQNAEAKTTQNSKDYGRPQHRNPGELERQGDYETEPNDIVCMPGAISRSSLRLSRRGQLITLEGTLRYREITEGVEGQPFKHRILESMPSA